MLLFLLLADSFASKNVSSVATISLLLY